MKMLNELFDCESTTQIYTIHNDSRYVLPYSVFFCVEGLTVDGHQYVQDAIFQGARCIVHSKDLSFYDKNVDYIRVEDTVKTLHEVCGKFYDYPSQKMKLVGVTGTSGKTIVSTLISSCLGKYCMTGNIGTLLLNYSDVSIKMPYTTPDILFIQRHLAKMVEEGVKVTTLETSSHGLALGRVSSLDFDIGVLTNIGSEHLDFHGTKDEYVSSKMKLFRSLRSSGYAILNRDDSYFEQFKLCTDAQVITFGIDQESDVCASHINYSLQNTVLDIRYRGMTQTITSPLLSKINVYNLLAMVGVMLAIGCENERIVEAIASIEIKDGRYEKIHCGQDFDIMIDLCQTLSNFEEVLKFVESVKEEKSRVIGVYGGHSKRNADTRISTGKLANQYLDHFIITELDDRGESVEHIAQDIVGELNAITSVVVSDRSVAIEQALEIAMPGDIVLLLGKGSEDFMSLPIGQIDYLGDKTIVEQYFKRVNQIQEAY